MLSFKGNPYSYGTGSEQTNTPSIKIEVTKSDGTLLQMDDSNEPITASITTNLNTAIQPTEISASNGNIGVNHTFRILSSETALQITFDLVRSGATYNLLGNLNTFPNERSNLFFLTVTPSTSTVTSASNSLGMKTNLDGSRLTLFIAGGSFTSTGTLYVFVNETGKF